MQLQIKLGCSFTLSFSSFICQQSLTLTQLFPSHCRTAVIQALGTKLAISTVIHTPRGKLKEVNRKDTADVKSTFQS